MKIAVVGLGYVGLSNAVLLAQHHSVVALDVNAHRVAAVNRRECPIEDGQMQQFLAQKPLDLQATTDAALAYQGARFVLSSIAPLQSGLHKLSLLCILSCRPQLASGTTGGGAVLAGPEKGPAVLIRR